jgi:dTDP-4-amino-4,6-dideoxygalactose transaminase
MVIAQEKAIAERLVLLRNHGAYPKYYHKMVGGNFRLDPIQAAALRVKLPYLERWHKQRAENARYYNRLFTDTGLVARQKVHLPTSVFTDGVDGNNAGRNVHIYNQYVLRAERRNELIRWLAKNDIGCEIYYPVPLHKQECLGLLTTETHCPEAEKAAEETLALPIYPELSSDMQSYVVEKIVQFYR